MRTTMVTLTESVTRYKLLKIFISHHAMTDMICTTCLKTLVHVRKITNKRWELFSRAEKEPVRGCFKITTWQGGIYQIWGRMKKPISYWLYSIMVGLKHPFTVSWELSWFTSEYLYLQVQILGSLLILNVTVRTKKESKYKK